MPCPLWLLCCCVDGSVSVVADDEVGDASHLLVDEDHPKRSLAVLYAIAQGSFILSHHWLLDFDEAKGWQPPQVGEEAAYEAKCWTATAKRRAERTTTEQKRPPHQRLHHSTSSSFSTPPYCPSSCLVWLR